MAQYRALHRITAGANWPMIDPGVTFSDTPGDSVPQMVPGGWIPPAACEPISADAIQNFWNAGPQQLPGPLRVSRPAIYWTPYPAGGGTRPMILTGAGAALGFQNWTDTRGAAV
jgi:hypothetical protein